MFRSFHWSHHSFSVIWLVSALAFFALAYDSFSNLWITLPRYEKRIPMGGNFASVSIGNGPSFNEVIDGIADAHDASVSKLEESIRGSARLTLVLNLLSGFASLGGFFTQRAAALHEHRSKHNTQGNADQASEPPIAGQEASEVAETGNGDKKKSDSQSPKKKRWYDKIWGVH